MLRREVTPLKEEEGAMDTCTQDILGVILWERVQVMTQSD